MNLSPQQQKRISKFLSLVLRHQPEKIGIQLAEEGWVAVDTLLAALQRHGASLSREELDHLVAINPKQRYAYNEAGTHIRAQQGHSVPVELGYESQEPPEFLYHGTVAEFLPSIQQQGIQKRARHDVHLSVDRETATNVGQRRGKPVLLRVQAAKMHQAGHPFFQSGNGVWLTKAVPPEFIEADQ